MVSIQATVNNYVSWVTARPNPLTGLEGKFSIFHAAAVACLDRKGSVRQFSDERVNDEDAVAMRSRIEILVDDTMAKDAASVTIRTTNGESSRAIPRNKGTPGRPMSDGEIEAKFLELAHPRIGDSAAREACALCWRLDEVDDAAKIISLCAGGAA